MDRYIARANVDHFLHLLDGDLTAPNRSTITKLLIEEEDKFGRDVEHLEFAEMRVVRGRERVAQIRKLRDGFAFGTSERSQAESLLITCVNTQTLLEDFCHRLRLKIGSDGT